MRSRRRPSSPLRSRGRRARAWCTTTPRSRCGPGSPGSSASRAALHVEVAAVQCPDQLQQVRRLHRRCCRAACSSASLGAAASHSKNPSVSPLSCFALDCTVCTTCSARSGRGPRPPWLSSHPFVQTMSRRIGPPGPPPARSPFRSLPEGRRRTRSTPAAFCSTQTVIFSRASPPRASRRQTESSPRRPGGPGDP